MRGKMGLLTTSLVVGVLAIILIGCGGGSGDGISGTGLNGTVATGAPVVGATVVVKGQNGKIITAKTNDKGQYSIVLDDITAPFLLRAEIAPGNNIYSIAFSNGTANVHPLTNLVVRNWYATKHRQLDIEFAASMVGNGPTAEQIAATASILTQILGVVYTQLSVSADFNVFSSSFNADHTGFDQILDQSRILVSEDDNKMSLELKDPKTGIAGLMLSGPLDSDLTTADTKAPTAPSGLLVLGANASQAIVVWNASSDNIAVAFYEIYRGDTKIASSPYPVYTDSGLSNNTAYCYSVIARDARGNASAKSAAQCLTLQTLPDIIAPSMATALSVSNASSSVSLDWQPAADNDVLGYHVYRSRAGDDPVKLASVVASHWDDFSVERGIAYCYAIKAFDAAGNVAGASTPACVTRPALPTVPVSRASPSGGSFSTAQSVVLGCTAETEKICNAIYFTLDGSAPTTSSARYQAPIVLSSSTTMKYFAVNAAGAAEAVHSETYVFGVNQVMASTVQFSAAKYNVSEASGTIPIEVVRTGDASMATDVAYKTSDATADGASDYISVSGRLHWDANDRTNKTFLVPVKGDAANSEATETVLLMLESPSGGSVLGAQANARIEIANVICDKVLSADITVDTVITDHCVRVTADIDVINNANLTIAPGVTLVFDAATGINVQTSGSLTAEGTEARQIFFTAFDPTPGYWTGIQLTWSNSSRNRFDHVNIDYGGGARNGSANLVLFGAPSLPNRVLIKNCRLTDSIGYGFEFTEGSSISLFSNNVVTRNKLGAGLVTADVVGSLDASSRYSGNTKDYIELASGSETVSSAQTWQAIDANYLVENVSVVTDLTVAAGATLVIKDGGSLNISAKGSLKAIGTAEKPVTFTGLSKTPGAWGGIQYTFSKDTNNELDHVIVEYGGGSGMNGKGNVITFGGAGNPQQLKLTNSVLRYSAGYGVDISPEADIRGFANNTIIDNALAPVRVGIDSVASLDANTDYSGNGSSYVEISGASITHAAIWKKLDTPYLVGHINVDAPWTVEPGVTMMFLPNSLVNVSNSLSGSLNAVGTLDMPITFTHRDGASGPWGGIQFTFSNNPSNKLINTVIEYAGASVGNGEGNIRLFGSAGSPSQVEIRSSEIRNGETYGAWLHDGAKVNADMATANTYSNNKLGDVYQEP